MSIGHGFARTETPNLTRLNAQARSLVAIAADCGWSVRESPLGVVCLEIGMVGDEIGYQRVIVPTTNTRGPWAISSLRKVLRYGTRNTAKYQAILAAMPDRGVQLSEVIRRSQQEHLDVEPPPERTPVVIEHAPMQIAEPAIPERPEPEPMPGVPDAEMAELAKEAADADAQLDGLWPLLREVIAADLRRQTAALRAELADERAKRLELEDSLDALQGLISSVRARPAD